MPRKRHGIYFNRKTKEIVSTNGHVESLDLKGWVKVSENPGLGLLPVRRILLDKRLVRDEKAVYWYGFKGSGNSGGDGLTADLTFLKRARRESRLVETVQRPRGRLSAVRRLLRSILGSSTAF